MDCREIPEVEEVEETLESIFSNYETRSDSCYVCDSQPIGKCMLCKKKVCSDHVRYWCLPHRRECPESCIVGYSLCVLCAAKQKRR
jgi:hypothetical protein